METIRPWPTGFVLGDTGNLRQLSPPTSLGVEVSPALAREAAFCNYPPQTTFERASGEPIHPDGNCARAHDVGCISLVTTSCFLRRTMLFGLAR